jgi:hypothetical protein
MRYDAIFDSIYVFDNLVFRNLETIYAINKIQQKWFLIVFMSQICPLARTGTVVCKQFASYQDYPIYKWDLIR